MDSPVTHMKDGAMCSHPDISISRSLQAALECADKEMTPAERISATESLRRREPVWHDGVQFGRG